MKNQQQNMFKKIQIQQDNLQGTLNNISIRQAQQTRIRLLTSFQQSYLDQRRQKNYPQLGSQIRNINYTQDSRNQLGKKIYQEEYKLKVQENIYNYLIETIQGKKKGKVNKMKIGNRLMQQIIDYLDSCQQFSQQLKKTSKLILK